MRKHRRAVIGVLAAALTAAVGMNAFAAQISEDAAKEAALSHAGVKEDDVSYIRVKLDREDGRLVYEVEFLTKEYREYDYELDAETGSVLKFDYEAEERFYTAIPRTERRAAIDLEEAKEIALSHAGLKEDEVTFHKTVLDSDDGALYYEIEFYKVDRKSAQEYDYEISAYTGEILQYDMDAESYGPAASSRQKESISAEEVKTKALDKAGRKASEVSRMEIEKEYDDGRLVYEGSFRYGRTEYEFTVDAVTGSFLSWEVEYDD